MENKNIIVEKEDSIFIAKDSKIGTVSQGFTKEKALTNLKEATDLYLEEFGDSV